MKITLYLPMAAVSLALASQVFSADADLVDLIKGGQQSSMILKYSEPDSEPSQTPDGESRPLKRIMAFGSSFGGELAFNGGVQTKLLMWTHDPSTTPEAGVELFEKMAGALRNELGQGKAIASIPNHGDASEVKSAAVLWSIGTDIVLLQLDRYPARAGVNVVRQSRESWRSSMGADEADFWVRTLAPKTAVEPPPSIPKPHAPGNGSAPGMSQSETQNQPKENTPPSKRNDESKSSTPWTVIVGWIVAAIALLGWLMKRRS